MAVSSLTPVELAERWIVLAGPESLDVAQWDAFESEARAHGELFRQASVSLIDARAFALANVLRASEKATAAVKLAEIDPGSFGLVTDPHEVVAACDPLLAVLESARLQALEEAERHLSVSSSSPTLPEPSGEMLTPEEEFEIARVGRSIFSGFEAEFARRRAQLIGGAEEAIIRTRIAATMTAEPRDPKSAKAMLRKEAGWSRSQVREWERDPGGHTTEETAIQAVWSPPMGWHRSAGVALATAVAAGYSSGAEFYATHSAGPGGFSREDYVRSARRELGWQANWLLTQLSNAG